MLDEQGKTIPHADALRILNKLPGKEYKDALARFSKALVEAMVPNTNGAASNSLLPVSSPQTATPPDGSQP
jgi:hypothetical protein